MRVAVSVGGQPLTPTTQLCLDERTGLRFELDPPDGGRLKIFGEFVPLSAAGRADDRWVHETLRGRHVVGTVMLQLFEDGRPEPTELHVYLTPSQATEEEFRYMLGQLEHWGALSTEDSDGVLRRGELWRQFAPDLPTRGDEVRLLLPQLTERLIAAVAAIQRTPTTALTVARGWREVNATGGRRVLPLPIHPYRTAQPAHAPVTGVVPVQDAVATLDTPEHRYVVRVARRLVELYGRTPALYDAAHEERLRRAIDELRRLFTLPEWRELPQGPRPAYSTLLRFEPHYRDVRVVDMALDEVWGGRLAPLPADLLNLRRELKHLEVLWELWATQATRTALRMALGQPAEPGRVMHAGEGEELPAGRGDVVLRYEPVYRSDTGDIRARRDPLTGRGRSSHGEHVEANPDIAIELRPPNATPSAIVVDPTWSDRIQAVEKKMRYARMLCAGPVDALYGHPRVATRCAVAVVPADSCGVTEISHGGRELVVRVPPSSAGWSYLTRVLATTIERELAAAGQLPELRAVAA